MSRRPLRLPSCAALLLALLVISTSAIGFGDPPGRVARLGDSQGVVSYCPAGEEDWFGVVRNRPLVVGDRLWTDRDGRLELQVGSAAVRIGAETSLEILQLDDSDVQLLLSQGSLSIRVRRFDSGQQVEIATPNLAFTVHRPGRYRVDVDPYDQATTLVVWEGEGEAWGQGSSFPLRGGDAVRFYSADLRDYEIYGLPREDGFDRYGLQRDQLLERSLSLRYVHDDMVGYADLDRYGSWTSHRSHGPVWYPSRVRSDWAPYRDGHWIWQEPWGWTWVDDAPWGFAPSHYGRWAYLGGRWGWMPGPRTLRPVYAPALVAFVGGSRWSLSISFGNAGPIGWFPLGPRDVYVPSYRASRDYFSRVNLGDTYVDNRVITNIYNNYASGTLNVSRFDYGNRSVAGAMTVVPGEVFTNARPVRQSILRYDADALRSGDVMRVAQVAPSVRSVRGQADESRARPTREALERRVIAREPPPPPLAPFATRMQQLQRTPGLPATEPAAARGAGQGRSAQRRSEIRVVAPQREAVDVRSTRPARNQPAAQERAGEPAALPPLDRSRPATAAQPARERGNAATPADQRSPQEAAEAQERRRASQTRQDEQRQADQQRQNEQQRQRSERQADETRQAQERERASEARQEGQRQSEQQRQRSEREAVEARQAQERQRGSEARQQEQRQADQQRQEDQLRQENQQRRVDQERQRSEQQADEAQERRRGSEARQQQQRQADEQRQSEQQQQRSRQQAAEAQERERAAAAAAAAEAERLRREEEARRQAEARPPVAVPTEAQRGQPPQAPPRQARPPRKDADDAAEDEDDAGSDKDKDDEKDKDKGRSKKPPTTQH